MTNHDKELLVQYGQDLSKDHRRRFHHIYMSRRKDVTPAVLLALFLGGVGAHHFYLGHTLLGVVCILFFWTFVPAVIALIEAIFMSATVKGKNAQIAQNVLSEIELIG